MERAAFRVIASGFVALVALAACGHAKAPGPAIPTSSSSTLTPDSECGQPVEYIKGQEPASLLGSCSDGKICTEYRWDSDADPSTTMKDHCESSDAKWSVGACPQESALGGCRAVVFYERCRSMTTTWVLEAASLEPEKKRCTEISGELLAGPVPEAVTPDPDP
jgi:hypothetical protein